jgi:hypothetical protein
MSRRKVALATSVLIAVLVAVVIGCGGSQAVGASAQKQASSASSATATVAVQSTATNTPAPIKVSKPKNTCVYSKVSDFVNVLPCELGRVGRYNHKKIDPYKDKQNCGSYVGNDFSNPRCAKAIARYKLLLLQARDNLNRTEVPTGLEDVAADLQQAITDDLVAADTGLEAYYNHDWGLFLKAWGQHGTAWSDLRQAGEDLGDWMRQKADEMNL